MFQKLDAKIFSRLWPYVVASMLWLLFLSFTMVADVWDETNALVILNSEPVLSMNYLGVIRTIWLAELPLDIYRPVGSSIFLVLGKMLDGNFIALRYFNAILVLASALILSSCMKVEQSESSRRVVFFVLMIFSSSAYMTASWFANVFDASCLFFFSVAYKAYTSRWYSVCVISSAFSIFSKEAYVLFIPFLLLTIYSDKERSKYGVLAIILAIVSFSLIYWSIRQQVVAFGSGSDIHSFELSAFVESALSFLAGFLYQFSKFQVADFVFGAGIVSLAICLISLKSNLNRLATIFILAMSVVIYWGMFGYQGSNIVTSHNFVGRLYLIPYAIVLYLFCADSNRYCITLIALFSVVGLVNTYSDHLKFQETYDEIYSLAAESNEPLKIYYPEKALQDTQRNIFVGNLRDADYRINVADGGIIENNLSRP